MNHLIFEGYSISRNFFFFVICIIFFKGPQCCQGLFLYSPVMMRLYTQMNSKTNLLSWVCDRRLVHSGPDKGSPQPGGELSFATRTGTRLGIEAHLFRAETCKELSLWTRHIVTGCHTSAEMIKEVTTSEYPFIYLKLVFFLLS